MELDNASFVADGHFKHVVVFENLGQTPKKGHVNRKCWCSPVDSGVLTAGIPEFPHLLARKVLPRISIVLHITELNIVDE
jgi:hypothetical protein